MLQGTLSQPHKGKSLTRTVGVLEDADDNHHPRPLEDTLKHAHTHEVHHLEGVLLLQCLLHICLIPLTGVHGVLATAQRDQA